jgi:hypothetical protein
MPTPGSATRRALRKAAFGRFGGQLSAAPARQPGGSFRPLRKAAFGRSGRQLSPAPAHQLGQMRRLYHIMSVMSDAVIVVDYRFGVDNTDHSTDDPPRSGNPPHKCSRRFPALPGASRRFPRFPRFRGNRRPGVGRRPCALQSPTKFWPCPLKEERNRGLSVRWLSCGVRWLSRRRPRATPTGTALRRRLCRGR